VLFKQKAPTFTLEKKSILLLLKLLPIIHASMDFILLSLKVPSVVMLFAPAPIILPLKLFPILLYEN
jgi:hypothetical protein